MDPKDLNYDSLTLLELKGFWVVQNYKYVYYFILTILSFTAQ